MMSIPVFKRSWNKENCIWQLVVWNVVIFVEFPHCRYVITSFLTKPLYLPFFFFFENFTLDSKGSPTFSHTFHGVFVCVRVCVCVVLFRSGM